MPRVRTVRPFVCLLLAVSTAGGTVMTPYRACACAAHPGVPDESPVTAASPPSVPAPPCCPCCPPTTATATADCCCQKVATTSGRAAGDNPSGCECSRCEGHHPVQMPNTLPPGGGAVTDHLADLAVAVATPLAMLFPQEWNRPEQHAHLNSSTPTDLVLVLSRLTI